MAPFSTRRSARLLVLAAAAAGVFGAIDRQVVVQRHTVNFASSSGSKLDPHNVLTVGNGALGFNIDATGLQSLNESYAAPYDLSTLTDWGYHVIPFTPSAPREALETFNFSYYNTPTGAHGSRAVPYATDANVSAAAQAWIHANPHRYSLGQLALRYLPSGSGPSAAIAPGQLTSLNQTLDLWRGAVSSSFVLSAAAASELSLRAGSHQWAVATETAVHPDVDLVAVRVTADAGAPVAFRLAFPYAIGDWGPTASAWDPQHNPSHTTTLAANGTAPGGGGYGTFLRELDYDGYRLDCAWGDGTWILERTGPHAFELRPPASSRAAAAAGSSAPAAAVTQDLRCLFSPRALHYPIGGSQPWLVAKSNATGAILQSGNVPSFDDTAAAAAASMAAFWSEGAFVDIAGGTAAAVETGTDGEDDAVVAAAATAGEPPSESESGPTRASRAGAGAVSFDPTALELERRVVLSLYLTRVNSAGAAPPQETGLLCNSWSGKHHGEMRYWHQGFFPLWARARYLARSDGFYFDVLANATSYAGMQGYDGARWPKMVAEIGNRTGIDVPWLGQRCTSCVSEPARADGEVDSASGPSGGDDRSLRGGAGQALTRRAPPYRAPPSAVSSGFPDGSPFNLALFESVNGINPVLVWEQPHQILLAELQRRAANATGGDAAAAAEMVRLAPIVIPTAALIASFVYFNETSGVYGIGPPVMGGEESGDFTKIAHPAFEVTYFAATLDVASEWASVLHGARNATWDAIARGMVPRALDAASPPSMPLYTFNAASSCCFLRGGFNDPGCPAWAAATLQQCNPTANHPMVIGQHGMVNGMPAGEPGRYGLNANILNNTVAAVLGNWTWGSATKSANVWGWDFPLLAQAMVRLGWDPLAVVTQALLMDVVKNSYLPNGHNFQSPDLPAYLPGNGGLLLAVGLMAAGSESSSPVYFPPEWRVQAEGFKVQYF